MTQGAAEAVPPEHVGAPLLQIVERVRERTVRAIRSPGIVQRAVVHEAQKQVEEAPAGMVVRPLHDEAEALRPLTRRTVRAGPQRDPARPQVVDRHVGDPVVVRVEPALDHLAFIGEREPRRRSEEAPPRERRQLVRIRRSCLDCRKLRLHPLVPDGPLFLRRTRHLRKEREREVLDVRPDSLVGEQATQLSCISGGIGVPEIGQHLADLRANRCCSDARRNDTSDSVRVKNTRAKQ